MSTTKKAATKKPAARKPKEKWVWFDDEFDRTEGPFNSFEAAKKDAKQSLNRQISHYEYIPEKIYFAQILTEIKPEVQMVEVVTHEQSVTIK